MDMNESRLPWRHRILLDIFFHGGAARTPADVMERLRIFDTMFLAEGTAAAENEFLDVVAVGAYVIIAEERKSLAALRQFCPQSRTMIACWPFGPVGAVGVDDLLDHAAHVHDPVDLRPPRVVILLLNG